MSVLEAQVYDSARLREFLYHSYENSVIPPEKAEGTEVNSTTLDATNVESQRLLDSLDFLLDKERDYDRSLSAKIEHRTHQRRFNHQLSRHLAFALGFVGLMLLMGLSVGSSTLLYVAVGYLIGTLFTVGISKHAFNYEKKELKRWH